MKKPWRNKPIVRVLGHPSLRLRHSGFTVVEALMAMLVASALMVAIGPVVALSVSARVQARRVDLATQAARSYIDGLRSNAIDPPTTRGANFTQVNLGVPAPSAMSRDQGVDRGNCLDKNLNSLNSCSNDPNNLLVIQAFRDGPLKKDDAIAQGYCLGVRVYRADAFQSGVPTETRPAKSALTNSKKYPLVVMRTQITNSKNTLEDYQKLYQRNPNNANSGQKPNPCDG